MWFQLVTRYVGLDSDKVNCMPLTDFADHRLFYIELLNVVKRNADIFHLLLQV